MRALCLLVLLLAVPARGEELVPAIAVADVLRGPLSDAFDYRAVLVESDDGVDLHLFVEGSDGWRRAAIARDIAWRGTMAGQRPSLEAAQPGSLRLVSQNDSIGRHRWEQRLTLAYRGGRFVVAGYTFSARDTLDLDSGGSCDVNLLSGRGLRDGTPITTTLAALPVEDWTMDTRPPECDG